MDLIINGIRYFYGYRINSNLHYKFNKDHLKTIIAVLKQSKQTMAVPMVAHYTIYITSEFDVTTLMPRIKRVLEGLPVAYAYSVELSKKLHIHLMLALDTDGYDDIDELFIDRVIPAISNLKHVMNCGCEIIIRYNTDSYYHDLRDSAEFDDAIERYSYFAKTNQKKYVTKTFKRAFNTSQITDKKYFKLGKDNMATPIHNNDNQELEVNDYRSLSDLQMKVMNKEIKSNNFKVCINITDKETHSAKWIYVVSCDYYAYKSEHALYVTLDELWNAKQIYDSSWYEELSARLHDSVDKAVERVKSNLSDDQVLSVYILVPKLQELEEVLSVAVSPYRQVDFDGFMMPDVENNDCLARFKIDF